ncbi:MAG: hypothetical protein KJI69_02710 [Patescibacteria group bacterium]|nr:hypothetical protein [Patescibacteria group bacterium]
MALFRYTNKKYSPFGKHGGKITKKQFEQRLKRVPLQSWRKEYVERVMEKFDEPRYSRGITEKEFNQGLKEMLKNKRDRIEKKHIDRIKKYF